MIEYYCDLCKKRIDGENELRYVVQIDIVAAFHPTEFVDDDAERDLLAELQQLAAEVDEEDADLIERELHQEMRFDLCEDCRLLFLANPLGKARCEGAVPASRFSPN